MLKPDIRFLTLAMALSVTCASANEPTLAKTATQPLESIIEAAVVSGSGEPLQHALATLEATGGSNPDQVYLTAYTRWRIAQLLRDGREKERKSHLKSAQKMLEKMLGRNSENAEAIALLGSVIGDRIQGAVGGMFLGPKASRRLEEAHELAPQNPRVALLRGIGFYFTPGAFGGGLDKAEAELRRARELFAAESMDKPWPNWGRADALAWHGIILADSGKTAEARSAYEEALRISPGHYWIENELLPALQP